MIVMATKNLTLKRSSDGYYRTSWVDDRGDRHYRSFGKQRVAAQNRFSRFHMRWQSDPAVRNPTDDTYLTIQQAWARFASHADEYYRREDGTPTGEADNIRLAMRPVLELYGDEKAASFDLQRLREARDVMVDDGLCVNVINQRVNKIRHVWRWMANEGIVIASVWYSLKGLLPLEAGRLGVRVTKPVQPVPDPHVWAVVDVVEPTIRAMISVQYYSGMRPQEVCDMRPVDIDTTGKVWLYRPQTHKTKHRFKDRVILLGPNAQEAVRPFLTRDINAYLFSPRETIRQRYESCRNHRHQPVQSPKTSRRIGVRYSAKAYGYRIRRACQRHGIPHWSPNQLRHNAATRLRKQYGLEVAQAVLGHSKLETTQIYAAVNQDKAITAIEKVG